MGVRKGRVIGRKDEKNVGEDENRGRKDEEEGEGEEEDENKNDNKNNKNNNNNEYLSTTRFGTNLSTFRDASLSVSVYSRRIWLSDMSSVFPSGSFN